PDTVHLVTFRAILARLWILQGRTREGLTVLLALGRRYEAIGGRNPAFFSWRPQAALALLELGEREEACRLAAEEVELARQWGAPRALGHALRTAALVEEAEAGLALLREAVEVLKDSPALLERARALTDLGARSRRRSPPRDRGREHSRATATAPKDYGFSKGALPMRTACSSSETWKAMTDERTTQRRETYATFGCDVGGACLCDGAGGGVCLVGRCLRRRCQPRHVADRHFGQLQQPDLVVLPEPGDGQP